MSPRLLLPIICALALPTLAMGLLGGSPWAAVALVALASVVGVVMLWLEHKASERRAVILEAWEDRLAALEAREEKTRAEVDTLTRERALNRM